MCKEDLEASGAQLVQGIVQAPENGFVVLARRGLQGILWRHRKGKEPHKIELICHRQIKELPDELQEGGDSHQLPRQLETITRHRELQMAP